MQPRDLLNISVDDMDGGQKKTSNDQFTKMLNLKMHRLSTFRAVGQSGFGGRKAGGSARGSPKGDGSNLSSLGNSAIAIGDKGSEVKGLAEQMFGDDESTTSIVRVNEGSSIGHNRSFRGSIAGRGSIRSGSSGGGQSSLRNKLAKGL